ncbi:MAG: hypothetical protein E7161_04015 [Firmicutes bacterium]|nr:hypothetical protein [Bacillota bacterium]
MKKKNILDEREQVISKAEAKFYEIYSEIMDASELSVYQSEMLSNKMIILATELSEYMDAYNKYLADLKKKMQKSYSIFLLVTLISCALLYVTPYFTLLIQFISLMITLNARKKYQSVRNASSNSFDQRLDELYNTITNCTTFFEVKDNKREKRIAELDPVSKLEFTMACDFLQQFLNAEDVTSLLIELKGYDISIKNILLKMLQEDLHMDSDNLEELLNVARTKVAMENLESELKLCRNFPKNAEKK